ncbi:peptidoglycan-binding protein [Antarctobacter sp.]|uniref:peptidoglycan-binding protein n=1 Tax=Antarctobacter sp. TaxID=1872577 RepID=UPI003A8D8A58
MPGHTICLFKRLLRGLLALTLAVVLALTLSPAMAASITAGGDAIMQCDATLEGEIVAGDADKLRAFAKTNGWERAFAGSGDTENIKTLCLNSRGGNFLEGIEIGFVLGGIGMRTAVGPDRTCESACALAFMYGTFRAFEDIIKPERRLHPRGKLGFHAPGLVVPQGDYTETAVNDAYRVAIQSIEKLAQMRGMGGSMFPQDLFLTILGTPPEDMRYVRTVQDAAAWNIEVFPVAEPQTNRQTAIRNACVNAQSMTAGTGSNLTLSADTKLVESVERDGRIIKVTTVPTFYIEGAFECRLSLDPNSAQRSHLGKAEYLGADDLTAAALYRSHLFPSDTPIKDLPTQPRLSDAQLFEALAGTRPMPGSVTTTAEDPPAARTSIGPTPLIPATEADEARLALDRAARREIQRRLTLLDFDTGGIDGDLGANSRAALRQWQQASGLPVSGFLNAAQHARLIADSREVYDRWQAAERAKPKKRRVKVCQRGPLGVLINCRMEWR